MDRRIASIRAARAEQRPRRPTCTARAWEGVTCHSVRGTFASLAYAGGGTPAEVMDAMGHTDPSLALAIYAKVVTRKGGIGARIDTAMRDTDLADEEGVARP